jgi:hypothetical protein
MSGFLSNEKTLKQVTRCLRSLPRLVPTPVKPASTTRLAEAHHSGDAAPGGAGRSGQASEREGREPLQPRYPAALRPQERKVTTSPSDSK